MDKRSEDRVSSAVRFLVHVHECDDDPDMVGVSLSCKAVDFSIHGIQFRTDKVIAAAWSMSRSASATPSLCTLCAAGSGGCGIQKDRTTWACCCRMRREQTLPSGGMRSMRLSPRAECWR